MLKVIVATVIVAACAFYAQGRYEDSVSHCGTVGIKTSYVLPQQGLAYCRTCIHRKEGSFSVEALTSPTPREEWRLCDGGPTYQWNITPKPDGTVSGDTSQCLNVSLLDTDFPESYTVSVVVTWRVCREDGACDMIHASAQMQFDAIAYSMDIRPQEAVDGRGDGQLVDGYKGVCDITALGCSREDLLSLFLTAKCHAESWQNEAGSVAMPARTDQSVLRWILMKPLWYAKSSTSPDCCYLNAAEYVFSLNVDECSEHTKPVSVYLPSCDLNSRMNPKVNSATLTRVATEELESGYRVEVRITEFDVRAIAQTYGRSQYKEKIFEEEKNHQRQILRMSGFGFEDMFHISNVIESLGGIVSKINETGNYTFEAEREDDVVELLELINLCINEELTVSFQYWHDNWAFSEFDAKRRVCFNEAYKYHCCYESVLGANHDKVTKEMSKMNLLNRGGGK